jgi:hypothetical protein
MNVSPPTLWPYAAWYLAIGSRRVRFRATKKNFCNVRKKDLEETESQVIRGMSR